MLPSLSSANAAAVDDDSSPVDGYTVLEACFDDANAIQLALVDHRPSQVWRVKRAVYDIVFSSPASTDPRAFHATEIVADRRDAPAQGRP